VWLLLIRIKIFICIILSYKIKNLDVIPNGKIQKISIIASLFSFKLNKGKYPWTTQSICLITRIKTVINHLEEILNNIFGTKMLKNLL